MAMGVCVSGGSFIFFPTLFFHVIREKLALMISSLQSHVALCFSSSVSVLSTSSTKMAFLLCCIPGFPFALLNFRFSPLRLFPVFLFYVVLFCLLLLHLLALVLVTVGFSAVNVSVARLSPVAMDIIVTVMYELWSHAC